MNESNSETPSTRVETHAFGAEVHQLLKLMINALYSNREIFLRELVSNASDALDKLRFEALTDESLAALAGDPAIQVGFDAEAGTLTIEDNGIGMTREEVIDHLGTIARSGTARFLEQLSGDRQADARLIGQFGVGFYSAFIVADRVVVETRRAGHPADEAVRWSSDGKGEYTLEAIERASVGTTITLELGADHRDLLDEGKLRSILTHYSNHIAFPIHLGSSADDPEQGPVNEAQALWTRPRQELDEAAYTEFYEGLTGDTVAPATWAHHHVEGSQRYSLLLYVPGQAPFDLAWNRDDRRGVRLYIQRVFIMDAAEQLVPRYLRFLRGVVDSSDLPLNVSRELLQDSPLLSKIRATVTTRALAMIEKLAQVGGEAWEHFQRDFGAILKEGLIEDPDHRDRIARLVRFSSTHDAETLERPHAVSLADYKERAGEGCDTIWYLTAESAAQARTSPQLEGFRAQGIEVLLMTDPIDAWVVGHLHEFEGAQLKPVSEGPPNDQHDGKEDSPESADEEDARATRVAAWLGDRVSGVVMSRRLTDSPSCVVDPFGLDPRMRRMLEQAGQPVPPMKPRLELNPVHPLVQVLDELPDEDGRGRSIAELLLDEAVLLDGGELDDPGAFVRRINDLLRSSLVTPAAGTPEKTASE
jgi:molecular chaperone HtpG